MANDLQVVGLGLATLDVLLRLKDMPTWERGTRIEGFRLEGGGLVGTAMVASAKLGARVGFIGTAGTDESAEIKLSSMVEVGIDLSHMVRRPGPDDQVMVVHVHAETGERMFSGVRSGERIPVSVEELDQEYITSAEYLHLWPCELTFQHRCIPGSCGFYNDLRLRHHLSFLQRTRNHPY